MKRGRRRLEELTPDEKAILRRYLVGNTRSTKLDIKSCVVSGLESAQIIYQATNLGDLLNGFAL